jgi:hypothetical protein
MHTFDLAATLRSRAPAVRARGRSAEIVQLSDPPHLTVAVEIVQIEKISAFFANA